MEVWFRAYRRHEQARIAANDGLMTLLASNRLAFDRLAAAEDPWRLLPDAFPGIRDLDRTNRSVKDTLELIERSERQFVYMAIPYLVSVHHAFVDSCINMLRGHQYADAESEGGSSRLEVVHDDFSTISGRELPDQLKGLFHLVRHLRNRIVHSAGTQGSHLRAKWFDLPPGAADQWEEVAERPLPIRRSSDELDLCLGELLACIMTVTRIGREINIATASALDRNQWASIVIEDYRAEHPDRFRQTARRFRRCTGYARVRYGPLELTDEEVRAAIERSLGSGPE